MAPKKKVLAVVKIQLPAGRRHARAPGRHGPRARTASRPWSSASSTTPPPRSRRGSIIPVEITIYEDRTFTLRPQDPADRRPCCARPPALDKGAATAGRETGGHRHRRPDRRDRHHQAARPQHRPTSRRPRSRSPARPGPWGSPSPAEPADATHRRDGRDTHVQGKEVHGQHRRASTARTLYSVGRGGRPGEGARPRPSSTRRSSWRSGSGSTPARPTRSSAAPSRCPPGTGRTARVAVFAAGEKAAEARAAGADVVGADDLVARVATRASSTSTSPSPRRT